jgi:hypothetical protein
VRGIRNVAEDATESAINVQQTSGKHPDHIPIRRENLALKWLGFW